MSRNFAPGPFTSSPRTFVFFLLLLQAYADDPRPFWNIAHEANSILEILLGLAHSANGIQFVVTYDNDGVPQRVGDRDSHDCPCNKICGASQDIPTFIETLRHLTIESGFIYRKELTLIVVYNKLENIMDVGSREEAGRRLAEIFNTHYWMDGNGAKGNILLVIPSTTYSPFFKGFNDYLSGKPWQSTIGYDVASNDEPLEEIRKVLSQLGNDHWHMSQSVGVSKCTDKSGQCSCTQTPGGFERLKEAVDLHVGMNYDYMGNVLAGVLDENDTIRTALQFDLDTVLTDHPEWLKEVLQEPAFASKIRLADRNDNPWKLRWVGRPAPNTVQDDDDDDR